MHKWWRALEAAGVEFIDSNARSDEGGAGAAEEHKETLKEAVMATTAKDIAWTRDMLKSDLEDTAEWRRQKAVEYPDDRRNLDSAEEYDRLAKTVKDVPDDLLVAYSEAFEDAPDSERWQEMLKDIFRGFSDFDNATKLVQAFVDAKREEAEDENSEPTSDAKSYLVMSLRRVLDTNDVPPDVADKVIGLIEEWERTLTKS